MAINTNTNKRLAIKWVRDKAKAAYEKKDSCYICNSTKELELHHTHSLTNLLEKWAEENNYSLDSDDDVLAIRDEFIDTHGKEIYEDVYTLCSKHHQALHRVYGKSPLLSTASKQGLWIEKQRIKNNDLVEPTKLESERKPSTGKNITGGWFSSFYRPVGKLSECVRKTGVRK